MNEIQKLRNELAENGIEFTPEEVSILYEIAVELKELSQFSMKQLKQMFNPKDKSHRFIIKEIQKIKSKKN